MRYACHLAVILIGLGAVSAQPAPPSRVVLVLTARDFWHAEYAPVRRLLEASGVKVTVAALTTDPCQPDPQGGGTSVTPDVAIADLAYDQFDGVVVLGATGLGLLDLTTDTPFNRAARALVGASAALGKLVVGSPPRAPPSSISPPSARWGWSPAGTGTRRPHWCRPSSTACHAPRPSRRRRPRHRPPLGACCWLSPTRTSTTASMAIRGARWRRPASR
ncbi:MAG: DJ-1/PfpI family protein [Armatimonadetes bacterium]|nr:DJ-1/PfpI family protein [Armatimonadota bacterium]